MSGSIVSKRYAEALFQLAKENNKLDQFESELKTARVAFLTTPSLMTFLKHPKVTTEQKKAVVNQSFESFSKELQNTFSLIVERHREDIIVDMINEFLKKIDDEKGVAEATVESVRELTEKEKEQISRTFAGKVDRQSLNITNIVKPALIGGIRVRIGNRIFDGSVSGKLSRMERELVSNK